MLRPVTCARCPTAANCPFRCLTVEQQHQLQQLQGARISWAAARRRIIYCEGASADGAYHLCSGSVKLTSGSNGTVRIVALIKPGDWFGLESLLPRSSRMFTAIAREASTVCFIGRKNILELVHGQGEFNRRLVESLDVALHDAQQSAALFSGQRVRRNLLNALAYCDTRSIKLKNVELAELLGVSAETVCREIRNLNRSKESRVSTLGVLTKRDKL